MINLMYTHTHTLGDKNRFQSALTMSPVRLIGDGVGIMGCFSIQLKWTITLINLTQRSNNSNNTPDTNRHYKKKTLTFFLIF